MKKKLVFILLTIFLSYASNVVTPILNTSIFYPIKGNESYHQDYYKNNPIRYKAYRWNCGRDKRLKEIWGDKAKH
jgi:peptide-methionine (S)-S-oxide reductase